jgi:hypothetical protein
VTTSTLAVSVSSPPYCASITCRARFLPLPAVSMCLTAAALQAGWRSLGETCQLVTRGRATVVDEGADDGRGEEVGDAEVLPGVARGPADELAVDGEAEGLPEAHPLTRVPAPSRSRVRRRSSTSPA